VPSIAQELDTTSTAAWYRAARNAEPTAAWTDRLRCFTALSAILAEYRAAAQPYQCRSQPSIRRPSLMVEVADRAYVAHESVYRRWRAKQTGQAIVRWAGQDSSVKPVAALVAEAKIVGFWPYREGALQVADAFDMTLTEVAATYLRALAAWASDDIPLAACHPDGPPPCVAEDMAVLAARIEQHADVPPRRRAARLAELAHTIISHVLADASITPLGAFNAVRDEVLRLLTEPDSIVDRVTWSVAELSDRMMHRAEDETLLDAEEATRLITALRALLSQLAEVSGPR